MKIYTNQISNGLPNRKRRDQKPTESFENASESVEVIDQKPAGEIRTVMPVRLDVAATLILMK